MTSRIRLVSRSSTRTPAAASSATSSPGAMPVPPTSASTMFVSTTSGRRRHARDRREQPRRARARADGRRRRGRASCRARRAPPPRRCRPGGSLAPPRRCSICPAALDDRLAAREHGAERRRQALVERDDDGVRRRGEVGERDAERDGSVRRAARRRCGPGSRAAWRRRRAPRSARREGRAAGSRVRVLEDEQRRMARGDELLDLGRIHPPVLRPQRRAARAARSR